MVTCCAVHCANRQGCKPNTAFHRIPLEAERQRRWRAAINRNDWQPFKCSRVCSERERRKNTCYKADVNLAPLKTEDTLSSPSLTHPSLPQLQMAAARDILEP
uniref:THAP-type domain-containing protein n=1 Tax=Echeneis naucrates TaxID=173247 RepID=A0A665TPD2_ECHNA